MIRLNVSKHLLAQEGPLELKVDLTLAEKGFTALAGPSGSGKTTLLRMIAGLETPDRGTITVNDAVWFDGEKKINLPPQKRNIGFVFQDYALFPHMSVKENLLFAEEDPTLADELLELTDLVQLADRSPATLSGGQKQRVALSRALMRRPAILLLDEPLSALDPAMRTKLQEELSSLHRRFEVTVVMVSHDLPEIFKLSDRMVKIYKGNVVADGKPSELLAGGRTSHKFAFAGELLAIEPSDIVMIGVVAAGGQLVRVVLSREEAARLQPGDRVLVASKAFNPIVKKIAGEEPGL